MKAIDLFAGWGGFTLGATEAGVHVVWAANHWPLAVEAHAANHPETAHACQDLRQADWSSLPRFDLLLASPACQGHASASQPRRRPYHDALRATAWAVVDCADVCLPRAIIVENVPQFGAWRLFQIWCEALRRLGYRLSEHELVASRHGVPQRRRRLFVVGLRRRALEYRDPPVREPAIASALEWTAGEWRSLASCSPRARARIETARQRRGDRFVAQHVTGHPGVPLDEPIRTITGADQWVLVDGSRYRPLTIRETARAMGFPDSYRWPSSATRSETILGLGNAVCPPVARDLVAAVMEAA